MDTVLAILFVAMFGAAMGSFACCQARRIGLSKKEKKDLGERSVCLACRKQLKWYDNIPILSWTLLRGKCRYCGKKIGKTELISELAGLVAFLVGFRHFYIEGEISVMIGGRMLVFGMLLTILLIVGIYDALTKEMPVKLLMASIGLAGVYFILDVFCGRVEWGSAGIGILLLAGIYYLLYKISNEQLVGGGDFMMCLAIALVVHDWWLAIWVLFLANAVGAIVMLVFGQKKAAFGPFLVMALVIVFGFSDMFFSFL